MDINWTWLLVGIVLGMFVVPTVLAKVKGASGGKKASA